jgi:hypothetical protein
VFGVPPGPNFDMIVRNCFTCGSFAYTGFVGFFRYALLTAPLMKSAPAR